MAEDDKDIPTEELEAEEELLEEPAEPEEDEVKCEECASWKAGAPGDARAWLSRGLLPFW